jgi:SAM-dependent methyltransferase
MSAALSMSETALPFDAPKSLALNEVRLNHLESLGIGEWVKGKTVLDVGCGVGHFASWFYEQGADVTGIDTRLDNLREAERRRRGIRWLAATIGHGPNVIDLIGSFDLVICYGLLYHCSNPLLVLHKLKELTKPDGFLLIESIVCDSIRPIALLTRENPAYADQGVTEMSMRPSPTFITDGLYLSGFNWVARLETNFRTESDRFDWKAQDHGNSIDEQGAALRAIFVAGSKPWESVCSQ